MIMRPRPERFSSSFLSVRSVSMGSKRTASITAVRTVVLGRLWSGSSASHCARTLSKPCRKNTSCRSTSLSFAVISLSMRSLCTAGRPAVMDSRSCSVATSMRARKLSTSEVMAASLWRARPPRPPLLPKSFSSSSSSSSASDATGDASSSLPYRSSGATSVSSMNASSVASRGGSVSSSSSPTSLSHTPFSCAEMSLDLPPFSLRPRLAFAFAAFFLACFERTVAISSSVSVSSSSLGAAFAGGGAGWSSSESSSSPKSSFMIAAFSSAAGFVSVAATSRGGESSSSSFITGDIVRERRVTW
mmetsp:Transcript_8560/g.35815  ORF Transcript_8560/g.35815 Transcript_8560/m.35815 type:complete len:303 (+) Transcript_8560:631-1539(+)